MINPNIEQMKLNCISINVNHEVGENFFENIYLFILYLQVFKYELNGIMLPLEQQLVWGDMVLKIKLPRRLIRDEIMSEVEASIVLLLLVVIALKL